MVYMRWSSCTTFKVDVALQPWRVIAVYLPDDSTHDNYELIGFNYVLDKYI